LNHAICRQIAVAHRGTEANTDEERHAA
jgi:hypothetical protein